MNALIIPKTARRFAVPVLAIGVVICLGAPAAAQPVSGALFGAEIAKWAPQGFGDRDNSQAWSMAWWNNKLYVGTGRATMCTQSATIAYYYKNLKNTYPPKDADVECTPDPHDLPLRAEIWRWTPDTNMWEMVYQSPQDVPIQGTTNPVKYVARDVGYRGMIVFTEADGTQALYVAGDSSRAGAGTGFDGPVPPPRILRSTDGVNFEALPQDPGTFLGDTTVSGFRSFVSYKGRLFVVGSVGQLGHGIIMEAARPEEGNNAFRQISPPGVTFFEIEAYNGFLWAGTGMQPTHGTIPFALMKTDATGDPYNFITVIPDGAYKKQSPSPAVISLHEFKGRLYVGTDREVLRVNPDDTWDLVVGTPRKTPDGRMLQPLSGFDMGFDNFFNIHIWRMGDYAGWLYVGTQDQSAKWRNSSFGKPLKDGFGFDLFTTSDGWHYSTVTRDGFGDIFNNGMRNFAATPYGYFMGTANHSHGTWIYKGVNRATPVAAPLRLEVESAPKVAGLSWEGSPNAVRFHVWRDAGFAAAVEIGVTDASLPTGHGYVDKTIRPFHTFHYYVVAEDANGNLSEPSNRVPAPFRGPIATFKSLQAQLDAWPAPSMFTDLLTAARTAVQAADYTTALTSLGTMRQKAADPTAWGASAAWRGDDLGVLVLKLIRRVTLIQAGALPAKRVLG